MRIGDKEEGDALNCKIGVSSFMDTPFWNYVVRKKLRRSEHARLELGAVPNMDWFLGENFFLRGRENSREKFNIFMTFHSLI